MRAPTRHHDDGAEESNARLVTDAPGLLEPSEACEHGRARADGDSENNENIHMKIQTCDLLPSLMIVVATARAGEDPGPVGALLPKRLAPDVHVLCASDRFGSATVGWVTFRASDGTAPPAQCHSLVLEARDRRNWEMRIPFPSVKSDDRDVGGTRGMLRVHELERTGPGVDPETLDTVGVLACHEQVLAARVDGEVPGVRVGRERVSARECQLPVVRRHGEYCDALVDAADVVVVAMRRRKGSLRHPRNRPCRGCPGGHAPRTLPGSSARTASARALPRCETGIATDESESRQHVACPYLSSHDVVHLARPQQNRLPRLPYARQSVAV